MGRTKRSDPPGERNKPKTNMSFSEGLEACRKGDLASLTIFMTALSPEEKNRFLNNPNSVKSRLQNPLLIAALEGHEEIFKHLVSRAQMSTYRITEE